MRGAARFDATRLRRAGVALTVAFAAAAWLPGCGSGRGSGGGAAPATAADAGSSDPVAAASAAASAATTVTAGTSSASTRGGSGLTTGTTLPTVPSAVASTLGATGASTGSPAAPAGCEPPAPGAVVAAVPGATMRAVCRDLWLDAGWAAADEPAIVAALDQAVRRVLEVFERNVNGLPVVVMCRTPACIRHFTGSDGRNMTLYPGARAADGTFVAGERTVTIVTAPSLQWLEQILAHEFSHHELYGRLGGRLDRVPPWFNEGLATLVGQVPSCVPMPTTPVPVASLVDQYQWNLYTGVHPDVALAVYCAAARELDAWLVAHGRAELLQLIDDLAAGVAFADRYGPMYLDRAPMQIVLTL